MNSIDALAGSRRILHFGIIAWLLLSSVGVTSLQAASVRGRVLYLTNAPAAGAAVRLTSPKGVSPFSYSNRDGMYYLNGIAAGTYMLEVWQNRRLVSRQSVVVREPGCDVPIVKVP